MFFDLAFIFGLLLFAALYAFIMPSFIIMRGDDFGYYQSIVLTIQNHKVITSDWLEPTNTFLSLLCWGSYKLTQNFYLSTLGIMFIFSILNYAILYYLLNDKLGSRIAATGSLMISTLPVYIDRAVDFAGIIPALFFFLWAILLYQRRKWIPFFMIVFISYSIRQSAVILVILPVYDLLLHRKQVLKRELAVIFGGYILFALAILYLGSITNLTYAQSLSVSGRGLFKNFVFFSFLYTFIIGIAVLISAVSLTNLLISRKRLIDVLKVNIRKYQLPAFFSFILIFCYYLLNQNLFYINIRTSMIGQMIDRIPGLLIIIPVFFLIWFNDYERFSIKMLFNKGRFMLLGLIYIIAVSVRGFWWDSYFIEIIILSVLWVNDTTVPALKNQNFPALPRILFTVILLFNLGYCLLLKFYIDGKEELTLAYEGLLRNKTISIQEASAAPFGFLGWKLFPYFMKNKAKNNAIPLFFMQYVKKEGVYVGFWEKIRAVTGLRKKSEFDKTRLKVLKKNMFSNGFIRFNYEILQDTASRSDESLLNGVKVIQLDSSYDQPLYPLNNREWRTLIKDMKL